MADSAARCFEEGTKLVFTFMGEGGLDSKLMRPENSTTDESKMKPFRGVRLIIIFFKDFGFFSFKSGSTDVGC